jgi:hypothetical protein
MREDRGGSSVAADDDECPICFDPLAAGALCTLPCTHTFHAGCVEGMRKFGVKQVCPLCRAELPPGSEQLYDDACRLYLTIANKVARGNALWGALSKTQKRDMGKVIKFWRGAAAQGHYVAQFNLGVMYEHGRGVKKTMPRPCACTAKQPTKELFPPEISVRLDFAGHGVDEEGQGCLRA